MPAPFHLAIPVRDLPASRAFYGGVLGLKEGRSSDRWVDYDFFGHQLVVHVAEDRFRGEAQHDGPATNPVDGHAVPVPHFGIVLSMDEFHALADRVRQAGIRFVIEPYIRFKGLPGEQATMFFYDPSGNALEFKAFANIDQLFAKQDPAQTKARELVGSGA